MYTSHVGICASIPIGTLASTPYSTTPDSTTTASVIDDNARSAAFTGHAHLGKKASSHART